MDDIKVNNRSIKDVQGLSIQYPDIQRDFGVIHSKEKLFIFGLCEKSEKILAATILVTDIFSPNVLAEKLREGILRAHENLYMVLSGGSQDRFSHYENACTALLSYLSILRALLVSGFIGRMNYELLSQEVLSLERTIEQAFITSKGEYVSGLPKDITVPLSRDMFQSDGFDQGRSLFHQETSSDFKDQDIKDNKRHIEGEKLVFKKTSLETYKGQSKTLDIISSEQSDNYRQKNFSQEMQVRKETILNVLRFNGKSDTQVMMKLIPGTSQKTLQRDLNTLIAQGLVVRSGVKRWSVYSLKH